MVMKKSSIVREYNNSFFETVPPVKLTECGRLKLHTDSWGLLSDYTLESVKINRYKSHEVVSTAVLQVADTSGQVTCVIKGGKTIGLLFGLTTKEWSDIEDMCICGQQLFYREFSTGLSKNFGCAQKMFYNFCTSNQEENVLIAIFCRTHNMRKKDMHDALINVHQLRKITGSALDLYNNHLRRDQ